MNPRRARSASAVSATCLLLFLLAFGHGTAKRLGAQEPERVSGEVTCAECVITLDTVVTIGGLDGPGVELISLFSGVAVDPRGRVLIWEAASAEIAVFDLSGQYLQTIGGLGEGPGEFRSSISYVAVGPRYIHVFEYHSGRTMLDLDFRPVRKDRFPGQVLSATIVGDDVAVFYTDIVTPTSLAHRLNVLQPSGELASFGGRVYSGDPTTWLPPPTVAAGGGAVWAVPSRVNRLLRWDLAPEPHVGKVIERRVAEFDNGGDDFLPGSLVSAMLDDRGLWVTWHTADPDWKGPPPDLETLTPSTLDIHGLRDGWLDLVDPATGRTVARLHQDDVSKRFYGDYLVQIFLTDAGVPFIRLMKPRLHGSPLT